VPCSFGSLQTFGTFEARDEANKSYHRFEWKVLAALQRVGVLERAQLALRMVTNLQPAQVSTILSAIESPKSVVPTELETAAKTFRLPVDKATDDDKLVSTTLALFFLNCLEVSGFTKAGSKEGLSKDQLAIFSLLQRAILVALYHTKDMTLYEVPKEKKNFLDGEVVIHVSGFGIYPDIYELEQAGTGPESPVIKWFLDKKMVITAFRKVEAGNQVCLVEEQLKEPKPKAQANDMITFRCANELCNVSFPLKENTKEKIISCPLDDCGIKTNIWERLKLIQKLKKDFASAKEEFKKNDVSMAKDILKLTIDEWDRIILRPYREVDQLQSLLVKCLQCEIADQERSVVEGNQFGMMISKKHKIDVMPTDVPKEMEGMTSKMIEINKVR